ncbi:hypothetical protein NMY22_g9943 [Coprinellus aureogranulatus]|nr:hypothetical protein NMY22_g9943 [Coprinellus aureogranulatus]
MEDLPLYAVLHTNHGTNTKIADSRQKDLFGFHPKSRPAVPEVHPAGEHMVDLIVVTLVYIEKLRLYFRESSDIIHFPTILTASMKLNLSTRDPYNAIYLIIDKVIPSKYDDMQDEFKRIAELELHTMSPFCDYIREREVQHDLFFKGWADFAIPSHGSRCCPISVNVPLTGMPTQPSTQSGVAMYLQLPLRSSRHAVRARLPCTALLSARKKIGLSICENVAPLENGGKDMAKRQESGLLLSSYTDQLRLLEKVVEINFNAPSQIAEFRYTNASSEDATATEHPAHAGPSPDILSFDFYSQAESTKLEPRRYPLEYRLEKGWSATTRATMDVYAPRIRQWVEMWSANPENIVLVEGRFRINSTQAGIVLAMMEYPPSEFTPEENCDGPSVVSALVSTIPSPMA